MRLITLVWLLLFSLSIRIASAGEVREIELTDGSIITGEVQSLSSGIFTIKRKASAPSGSKNRRSGPSGRSHRQRSVEQAPEAETRPER